MSKHASNQPNITEAIQHLRDWYIEENKVSSYYEINCGYCVDFADEIESMFRYSESLSNDYFVKEREGFDGWDGDGLDIWNEDTLKFYNSLPPAPISVADLTEKILGYHSWIHYKEKHYDAECPEGVTNFFDLPFFKRQLDRE